MNTICYLFIFIFEQFISYLYFKSKYEFKRKTWIIFICYFISFIVQYTTNLFKKGHGIGIKSILKIVKKYYGNLDYTYIENENIFVTTILLKST